MISLNIEKTFGFISKEKVSAYEAEVKAAQEMLEKGTGEGNDFLGWLHLPSSISKEHLADLNATAKVLRDNCEVVIVAGIGGSYLGARAVIEALSNSFTWLQDKKTAPVMIYAGHNISEDYLYELTEYLKDKKFGVINISKSGTTTETALAFRLLKKQCEDQRCTCDCRQRRIQDIYHSGQRRRTFLCAHSGWFAADRSCRIRHRQTGCRCCRYGKGMRF